MGIEKQSDGPNKNTNSEKKKTFINFIFWIIPINNQTQNKIN